MRCRVFCLKLETAITCSITIAFNKPPVVVDVWVARSSSRSKVVGGWAKKQKKKKVRWWLNGVFKLSGSRLSRN